MQILNDITQLTIGILKHAEAKEPPHRRHRGRPDHPAPDSVLFLETDKVLSYFLNMIMLCKLKVFESVYMNNRDTVYDVWKLYLKMKFTNWGRKFDALIYITFPLYGICVQDKTNQIFVSAVVNSTVLIGWLHPGFKQLKENRNKSNIYLLYTVIIISRSSY